MSEVEERLVPGRKQWVAVHPCRGDALSGVTCQRIVQCEHHALVLWHQLQRELKYNSTDLLRRPRPTAEEAMVATTVAVGRARGSNHPGHRVLADTQQPAGHHRTEAGEARRGEARLKAIQHGKNASR